MFMIPELWDGSAKSVHVRVKLGVMIFRQEISISSGHPGSFMLPSMLTPSYSYLVWTDLTILTISRASSLIIYLEHTYHDP